MDATGNTAESGNMPELGYSPHQLAHVAHKLALRGAIPKMVMQKCEWAAGQRAGQAGLFDTDEPGHGEGV
ncbi:MAG: hypothetical protein U1F67_11735 [Rubrivivax sp.]